MVPSQGTTETTSPEAVLQVIRNRRSIGKCTDEIPDPQIIRQVLEAGTWAPNHKQTEPWRFVVLTGEARNGLGEAMGAAADRIAGGSDAGERARAKAVGKPLRAPYVIAIMSEPDPSVPEIEEIAATAAAAQNILLAAHSIGLAAMWRSGELIYTPEVRSYLHMSDRTHMLGVLYIGCPAMDAPQRDRKPVDSVTTWWDSTPAEG